MRMLMPSHASNVIEYREPEPLFTRFQIERQLERDVQPVRARCAPAATW